MADTTPMLAICTCPDSASASHLAHSLVEERLAACVNVVPGLTSVYRWEQRVHEDAEALLLLKTTAARLPALRDRVRELHPYDVPELIAVSIVDGLPDYLAWLRQAVA